MSKDRPPTDEDKKLWEEAMAGTAARPKPNIVKTPLKKTPRVERRQFEPVEFPMRVLEPVDVSLRQIPKNRARRVKYEAVVDLHGMTQDNAYSTLQRFLTACQRKGMLWVLVITGKGTKDGKPGVLRTAVPQWLSFDPFLSIVAGYAPAKDNDGGAGALYVRLKKILFILNTFFISAVSVLFSTGVISMQESFIESQDHHDLDEQYLKSFNSRNFEDAAKYLTLSAVHGNQDNRDFLHEIDNNVGRYLLKHESKEAINYYENVLSKKLIECMKNYNKK